ncbi:c-type cytochrome [Acidomonas methanolica]
MKKNVMKRAVLAGALSLAAGWLAAGPATAQETGGEDALVQRGAYISRLADCVACHTGLHGIKYAGGLKIATPIGDIYSTNITPDKETGIGTYTLADFTRALREGVRKDGATMYPAMPYDAFSRMSDSDIAALYAYFMHGVAPVHMENRASTISWPLSMRWPLAIWRALFAPAPKPMNTTEGSDDVARGEYIVTGPGHCGSCHTPRGWAMQLKAYDASGGPAFLAGGAPIDNWVAPSLRSDPVQGIGKWSEDDIVTFLKSGRIDHSAVFGGMADVVGWSTQYYTDSDLRSIAKYLKSLPDVPVPPVTVKDAATTTQAVASADPAGHTGASVYLRECAICHQNDGSGVNRMFPPLDGNPVIVSDNPTSVANVIVNGGVLPPTNIAPSSVAMPGFAHGTHALSDADIAAVTNFIREGWSNQAHGNVTAADIRTLRTTGAPLSFAAWAHSTTGFASQTPQPYGAGWTFSPQTHAGVDEAQ